MPFYFANGQGFDSLPSLIWKVGYWLPGAWEKEVESAAQWVQIKLLETAEHIHDNTLLNMYSSKPITVNSVSLMPPCLAWCVLKFPC